MPFEVIPAVDVLGGRLARMRGGDASTLHEQDGDVIAVAERFVEQGARWIHFVDLDSAIAGRAANRGLLARIAALPVMVQAGGALSREDAVAAIDSGADRAVVGSAALFDRDELGRAAADLGERAVLAVDLRGGFVSPRGHRRPQGSIPASEALALAREAGYPRIVHTDVSRDGALLGPDVEAVAAAARDFGRPVIASGGIRSRADLDALAATGVEAAIVGTALYGAGLDLADALDAAR